MASARGPDDDPSRGERLLQVILDSTWRIETLHERDCWACDVACDVAGTLAATWDTNGVWHATGAAGGLPGDTMLDQATRVAAWVLHRRTRDLATAGGRQPGGAWATGDIQQHKPNETGENHPSRPPK